MNSEERFINIEIAIANLQKTVDELNEVVINQGNLIDKLHKENKVLAGMIDDDTVKPLSEETPPPHYSIRELAWYQLFVFITQQF